MSGLGALGTEPFQSMSLEHSGAPGDLSAIGYTVQANGKTGFACPFAAHGEGAYLKPVVSFDLGPESTTLLLLRNVADEHISVQYALSYFDEAGNQGRYAPADFELAPNDFKVINFKHLRDQRVADRNGNVLPSELTRGSAFVVSSRAGALLVADPTVNNKNGGVRLCQLYCGSEAYYSEDGSTVPCFLLLKYGAPIDFAGGRDFTLINNVLVAGGYSCTFQMCPNPSPYCRNGSFTQKGRLYCPSGVTGFISYTNLNFLLFTIRFCFVNNINDLTYRPC